MKWLVIIFLIVIGVLFVMAITSIFKERAEAKKQISELNDRIDTEFKELNELIGYEIETEEKDTDATGKTHKYNSGSLLEDLRLLSKKRKELANTLNENTDTYYEYADKLVESLSDVSEKYTELKVEKESLEIALSIVIPMLTDEQLQNAQERISKAVTEINTEREKLLQEQTTAEKKFEMPEIKFTQEMM